ncbi:integrase, catalytic region, zinc finger, CCHC-type containing protein [Tanacetum coccineum]
MSNTNNTMQTQTSSSLHNAIMEAGGKDRPPMLAPGNYVQWRSRIKRYIDTKHNNELIQYCLQNPPYKFKWTEKIVPVTEGSSKTTTEGYMENYKNVSQDIRKQLDVEAKTQAVRIILTRIDNDIYSTVDACPNACEMWKAIERLKQDDEMSKEKEIDKLMALISLSFKRIYKPINNNLRTSSNTSRENQDTTPRINKGTGYDSQRAVNVVGARENVGTQVVQHSRIQCYNCKEYGHVARECQKPKWAKDADYHKEKMLLCKLKKLLQMLLTILDPSLILSRYKKVQNDDDNYNVFDNDKEHPEQPKFVNDTYLEEQGDTNITIDSLDMSTNGETIDQDDDDLARERDLLA